VGLLSWRSEQGALLSLTTLAYLGAFAVIGMPKNINWGLMFAPLLPFGVARAPTVLWQWASNTVPDPESARPKDLDGEMPDEPAAKADDQHIQAKDESIERK
jgi:hypothetical protein